MNLNYLKFDKGVIDSLDIDPEEKKILNKMLKESDEEQLENHAFDMLQIQGRYFSAAGDEEEIGNRKIFKSVKCEIYKFLCTNDPIYGVERDKIVKGLRSLIVMLAATIAGVIGVAVEIITGLIAALLLLILKFGKNAWCANNQNVCN